MPAPATVNRPAGRVRRVGRSAASPAIDISLNADGPNGEMIVHTGRWDASISGGPEWYDAGPTRRRHGLRSPEL